MQFGVREICDVVFKAKTGGFLNKVKKEYPYAAGEPILYIDSAKTSTVEGAGTTVYAQGGRGNSRLISWEGEKTLTFTVEDALLSEIGFAVLSGAQLFKYDGSEGNKTKVHMTSKAVVGTTGTPATTVIDLTDALGADEVICSTAPVFVMVMKDGSIVKKLTNLAISGKTLTGIADDYVNETVFVDYYVEKATKVTELTIDAENFAGYYYVEASTLFRRQSDGKDLPAELIFPNVKIQSNFTFTMASSGDPSTFTFTMDAMPGYTRFDKTKKVLCVMNIIDDTAADDNVLGGDSIADTTNTQPGDDQGTTEQN